MRLSAWLMMGLMIAIVVNCVNHSDQREAWVIAAIYFLWYTVISMMPDEEG